MNVNIKWQLILSLFTAQIIHLVPQGTESVNGSDVGIGCQGGITAIFGVIFCGHPLAPSTSYLTDGIIPNIDTSDLNWASQLVTVKKNNATINIPYDHVVLVFDTLSAMSLTSVELDMFICPQWNIGAPNITVYADENGYTIYRYNVNDNRILFGGTVTLSQSCHICNSLSTVRIPLQNTQPSFIWYIVVRFESSPCIEWVHIGEVRLLNESSSK